MKETLAVVGMVVGIFLLHLLVLAGGVWVVVTVLRWLGVL